MKNQIAIFLLALFTLNSYAQITFEKGYYIDNSNIKVNCLIKNKDWESNPSFFNYKLTDSSEIQTLSNETVKEFGIVNKSKYVRFAVDIDRSSESIEKMSNKLSPIFNKEVLFLKVLVEGKANLYQYIDHNLKRFFFKIDSSEITQLVYKKYLTSDNQVATNNYFKQQLLTSLKCDGISYSNFETLNYLQKSLEDLFIKYNNCENAEYVHYNDKQNRDLFNLTLRPGINLSFLSIHNNMVYFDNVDFGSKMGFRFGTEVELVFPFNKNKWAVAFEPNYQFFKTSVTTTSNQTIGEKITSDIDYHFIELALSLRHYFFLNDKSKIFVNLTASYCLSSGALINITRDDGLRLYSLKIAEKFNFPYLGLGYKYNDCLSLEIRYMHKKDILGRYAYWQSEFKTLSLIFGYTLF